jgi:hypothetical protein
VGWPTLYRDRWAMGLKIIGKENLEHKLLMLATGRLVATWHDDVIMSCTPNNGDVIQ